MFKGIYKGKTLNICTNALLWKGDFLEVKDNLVTLNKATAISVTSGIGIISTPQIYVNIPLECILSISVGEVKTKGLVEKNTEFSILSYQSKVTINKNYHVLQMR